MKDKIMFVYKGSIEKLLDLGFIYTDLGYIWSDIKGRYRFPYKLIIDNDIIKVNTPTYGSIALLMKMYNDGLIDITTRKCSIIQNLTKNELIIENERLKEELRKFNGV